MSAAPPETERVPAAEARQLVSESVATAGARVVDIGTGTGVLLDAFPDAGVRVGIDIDASLLPRSHLHGSFSVHAPGGRELARSAVPETPPKLRAQRYARAPIPGVQPLPRRGANSPWRKGLKDWHPAAAKRAMITARGRLA